MSIYEPTDVKPVESSTELPTDRTLEVADTGAGMLVFADCDDVGRELVAFADVTDWNAIRGALQKRGLDVGATYDLPVVDGQDVPRTIPEEA